MGISLFDAMELISKESSLIGLDLSGLDLSGVDLSNRILRGTHFKGTNLSYSNMSGSVYYITMSLYNMVASY